MGEHMSNLCAAELQGKIQQFEADNKVFLHEQQIQCLASLMELESEGASEPCQGQVVCASVPARVCS